MNASAADGAIRTASRYLTPSAPHRRLGLHCLGVGRQQGLLSPMRGRRLRSYAAVLITRGAGWLQLEGRRPVPLQAPALFWLFPHVAHSYAPARPGWTESWVLFDGLAGQAHEQLGHLSRTDPVVELDQGSPVPALFEELLREVFDAGPTSEAFAAVQIQRLLLAAAPPLAGAGGAVELVTRLEAGATDPGSIDARARRLGVTAACLRQAVRESGRGTVQEVIISTRMRVAKELLAVTDLPVYTVAGRVGYHDAAYFTRLFSRREGQSPSDFRAQQTRTADPIGGS